MLKCLFCNKEFKEDKWKPRKFCSRSCSTKWRYKYKPFSIFVKGHKVRVGMKHPLSFILKRRGEGNPAWKGKKVKQHSLHDWTKNNFKHKNQCEHCKKTNLNKNLAFDWSNKDHKYNRNREDWQYLCRSCHMKYDIQKGFRKPPIPNWIKNKTKYKRK